MKKVEVVCDHCSKVIFKPKGEYNRRVRLGKDKFYCNNSCSSKIESNLSRLKTLEKNSSGLVAGNRKDQFSDFRWYMKTIKNPDRRKKQILSANEPVDFDVPFLKELWESQGGRCPLAGVKMILRTHSNCSKSLASPYSASIDRIDNSVGYVRGNIRFICHMANMAKNRYSDEQVIEFCKLVADQHTH